MAKKILSALLAAVLLFSLASCAGKKRTPRDVTAPKNKKVGIVLTAQSQYPEDGLSAYALAKEYKNSIVIKQIGDSRVLQAGMPEIVLAAQELAKDESIGAIVFDRATQFTDKAIAAAKEINPSLYTFAIEPEREGNEVADSVTVEFVADWEKFAVDMINAAKEQGAEYFVTFSFPAHINAPLYANLNYHLEKNCKAQGIEYVNAQSIEPIYSGGIAAAKESVTAALDTLYKAEDGSSIKGENVALFSTDSSVQTTLVKLAAEKGLIYIMPPFPTAFNGIGEHFGIEYPKTLDGAESYISKVRENAAKSNGRFALYTETFADTLLRSAVYTAFDMLNDPELIKSYNAYLGNAADRVFDATDNKDFETRTLDGYFNAVLCYCPSLEVVAHTDAATDAGESGTK